MAERISMLVCTRNRADALATMLARLPVALLVREGAELVIVDNGSSDATPAVLAAFAAGPGAPLAPVLVREDRKGLSNARNAAIRAAHGTLFCFIDDDCYLGEGYFDVARRIFADPGVGYAGGRIIAHDPRGRGVGEMLHDTVHLQPPRSPVWLGMFQGASFIVRRRVFETIGLFDPALGAGAPFRCEDIEFAARASFEGFAGRHDPDLIVYHDHGRHEPGAIEEITRENALGSGSYYALCMLREARRGSLATLRMWYREAREAGERRALRWQIRGALAFVAAAASGRLKPYRAGTRWNEKLPPLPGT
ncbi:glycosyltransferase family 2 protein [Elioraea sp.]|uniref:glycosyltransferase family 2 protein n=1 Tax=Elioraea sp. TaxID=2185103 RepID=UPI0025B9EE95|nr:glycosyltransferase [Elioraea sp.]